VLVKFRAVFLTASGHLKAEITVLSCVLREGTSMILTDQEREKFAAWCRQEAATNDQFAKQLAAMRGMDAIAKRKRAETVALTFVASLLASIESVTLTDG
jgi:hypothetical protein